MITQIILSGADGTTPSTCLAGSTRSSRSIPSSLCRGEQYASIQWSKQPQFTYHASIYHDVDKTRNESLGLATLLLCLLHFEKCW
jgi:hypothetical protein